MSAPDQVLTGQNPQRIAAHFLRSVFAGQDKGVVVLFQKPSNHSMFVPLDRQHWQDAAAKSSMTRRDSENVFFAAATQARQPHNGRGTPAGLVAAPGLGANTHDLGPNPPAPH